MKNKNSLFLILAGTVTALAIILTGCSTEDPWSPEPSRPLVLEMVAGPDADTVAYGSDITYTWTSRGGEGEVQYRYRVDSDDWSELSNVTTVQLTYRIEEGEFSVRAEDEAGDSETISRLYYVGASGGVDTTPPTVWIESSPIEGSFVATGSSITFAWNGDDAVDGDNLLFWWTYGATVSDTSTNRTITFNNAAAADPAEFSVWAIDRSGNESDPAEVSFTVRDATILYIDDYQWLTDAGDVDLAKERDQKQFYRDALEGYAFAEWDYAVQGMPDSSDLVSGGTPIYSTILFASDTHVGDASGTWWFGAVTESPIHYYLESGGNFIVTGAETLPWICNTSCDSFPVAGEFEYDWLGIDDAWSTEIDEADSTWWLGDSAYTEPILLPDSITVEITYLPSWVNEWWFTWAVKDANTMLDLPDSMKIDVAKNGAQDDYASGVWSLRNDVGEATTEVLFRWGLWVDGDPPGSAYYQSPVGHITNLNSGQQWTAMLNFDTYSMPLPQIRQTFQAILTEFGE